MQNTAWNITSGILRIKKWSFWLLRLLLVHCDQNNTSNDLRNIYIFHVIIYTFVCYLFGIWKKHGDESEVHASLLYKLDLHLEQNKLPGLLWGRLCSFCFACIRILCIKTWVAYLNCSSVKWFDLLLLDSGYRFVWPLTLILLYYRKDTGKIRQHFLSI